MNANTNILVEIVGTAFNDTNDNLRVLFRRTDGDGGIADAVLMFESVSAFRAGYTRIVPATTYQADADGGVD